MATVTDLSRFDQPQDVSDLNLAFPANVRDLMPPYESIPREFTRNGHKWVQFQQDWFYSGLAGHHLIPRDGITVKKALRHLGAIQGSFEPKHEHKEAAVAYLASRWFTDDSTWEVKPRGSR